MTTTDVSEEGFTVYKCHPGSTVPDSKLGQSFRAGEMYLSLFIDEGMEL